MHVGQKSSRCIRDKYSDGKGINMGKYNNGKEFFFQNPKGIDATPL
jgi:hypothetical protein